MSDNYTTKFGLMSQHQGGKMWWFDTAAERDAEYTKLNHGFEARHGVYKWTPEQFLSDAIKSTGFYQAHGNHWY